MDRTRGWPPLIGYTPDEYKQVADLVSVYWLSIVVISTEYFGSMPINACSLPSQIPRVGIQCIDGGCIMLHTETDSCPFFKSRTLTIRAIQDTKIASTRMRIVN
jgi:hypothetical protein